MKKIFLIIYSPDIDNTIIDARISAQGRSFNFWNNHWLVESELNAKELYKRVGLEETGKKIGILISEFRSEYWGHMVPDIWDWLRTDKNEE